jgi:hypothetical protein
MAKDPKEVPCEWCGDPSTVAVEIERRIKSGFVKSGIFKYACDEHRHLAEALRIKRR